MVTGGLKIGRVCGWLVGLAGLVGCAQPQVKIPDGIQIEGYDHALQRIKADPIAYLRETLEASRKIKDFTARFQRQERLGLFRELKAEESIAAEYRDDPFSVRFTWLDETSQFSQCVYVKSRNDDKVLLLPRKGPMGAAPTVQAYPPSWAVLFHQSRNPITDFGPRRMMERILDRIEKSQSLGGVKVVLSGATEIGPSKEPCFHLELRYPDKDEFACKLQDLYISTQTHLPVATYLWLPGRDERSDDTLDAMYEYDSLNPNVVLTDAHFVIDPHVRAGATAGEIRTAGNATDEAAEPGHTLTVGGGGE